MANLNVRIKNKYDSYENWMNSSLVLEAGEIAIASIPSGDNTGLTPPALGIKVGDGSKTFSQLNWIQATAGDVYGWAKAATKPEYAASEIAGLEDFIAGEIQDTNTEYSFTLTDNYKVKVQKKDVGGEYADYQVVDLTSAFNAKADKVANATAGNFAGLDAEGNLVDSGKKAADFATAAQGALADSALQKADITSGSANGTIAVEGTDVAVTGLGSAAFTEASAYAPAGHAHDDKYAAKAATEAHIANGDIHVTADDKSAWNTAATKAAANEEAIKGLQPAGDYATKTEAQGYADAKDAAIEAAQSAADAAQGDVDALAAKVGDVAEDKTVVEMIADAQAAATYDDTALVGRVATIEGDYLKAADKTELEGKITAEANRASGIEAGLESRLAAVEGDYLKAADKTELQGNIDTLAGVVETLSEGVDPEKVDGVKDLIAYVDEHGATVKGLQDGIDANAEAIEGVAGRMTTAEGKITAVEGAVATKAEQSALNAAVEALEGADAGLDTRIKALESAVGESGSVAEDIAAAKDAAIEAAAADATSKANAAEKNAKDYADGLNTAMNTRVEALEAVDHEHANADVLAGITAAKVSAWDAAQANVLEGVAGVEGSIANKTFTVTGVSTDLLKQGSEVIIFDCGTSAV